MHGFYRLAAAVPRLKVADVEYNLGEILETIRAADDDQAALVAFPELCLSGYTCADLFFQSCLTDAVAAAIQRITEETAAHRCAVIVGAPLYHRDRLYNCAVVIQAGAVLGVVPKSFLPNYKEFYEKRWFSSGRDIAGETMALTDKRIPFGTDLIFEGDDYFRFAVEICEDLWNVIPPSSRYAIDGATVIANISASNELVGKSDYRRELVKNQSARCVAAYMYTGAGVLESTTDVVFSGHALIAENGVLIVENRRFRRDTHMTVCDVDCRRLQTTRVVETALSDNPTAGCRHIPASAPRGISEVRRSVLPHPFVPDDPAVRDLRCREIFDIQASGLAKRLEHTEIAKAVVGVSGGLDSTLALLVAQEAFDRLGRDHEGVLAITMPGFGTSERTYSNAVALCRALKTDFREIDIVEACRRHFADIGHDPDVHDVTYENVQARERTQVLMDIANKEGGLVIGTGDLSEIALGWCTYSGDHMSMYAVNCSVPKTLIRYLIGWVAENCGDPVRKLLHDILDTPVTPELLPKSKDGEIAQKTEEVVGPYELHDFFLYHVVKYGAAPEKILFLAALAFGDSHEAAELEKWLKLFLQRFFANQFKRSCVPDGPKVGTISLSPRGDWRMPSDASYQTWLKS